MTNPNAQSPASGAGAYPAAPQQPSHAQGDERAAVDQRAAIAQSADDRAAAFDPDARDIAEMRDSGYQSDQPGTHRGHTDIAPRGVERVVEKAVRQIPGIADLDARLAGLGGRGYPRINVQLDGERQLAAATADIAVTWPSPVTAVAEETRYVIAEAIRVYTGYTVSRVNVTVGESVPGERVTRQDIAHRPLIEAIVPHSHHTDVTSPVTSVGLKDLTPIEVTSIKELRGISRGEGPEVRSVEAPEPKELRAIGSAREHEARSVSAPEQRPLRAVGEPQEHEARVVSAPEERPLRRISAPEDHTPRRVTAPEDHRLRRVEAPRPAKLRPIEVQPLNRITKVRVPQPQRLKTPKAAPAKRLKKISTTPKFRKKPVSLPTPQPLRHISVDPVKAHPLHVEAPKPAMLREVEVREVDVWHPTLRPARSHKHKIHLKTEGDRRG